MNTSSSSKPILAGAPLLIAHRGGAGLAPENTLAAFRRAIEIWQADMIEFDVRASADGHCVVIHDSTIDRTTDGSGEVEQLTLAELRQFDAGYRFTPDGGRTFPFRGQGIRIPTIQEVFEQLPPIRVTIELKTAAAQAPLFEAIRKAKAQDRVVAAGEYRAFRDRFNEWTGTVSACREDIMPFYVLHRFRLGLLARVPADVVQVCEKIGDRQAVTPRLIRELRKRGIPVHIWTVNEVADMHRLLDWGAEGIITDYPDRLARVLHERVGRPLPPGFSAS